MNGNGISFRHWAERDGTLKLIYGKGRRYHRGRYWGTVIAVYADDHRLAWRATWWDVYPRSG